MDTPVGLREQTPHQRLVQIAWASWHRALERGGYWFAVPTLCPRSGKPRMRWVHNIGRRR